ncbi:MAG: hypothetical protein KDK78_03660 [Chlamydiia bacterium]|nr:hypothetical protein [Chlamydiia bacterium]
MQQRDDETERIIQELMALDDGVHPDSPLPISEQHAAQRRRYRDAIEMRPFQAMLEHAITTLVTEHLPTMDEDLAENLVNELNQAALVLGQVPPDHAFQTNPEILGISEDSISIIFDCATEHYAREEWNRARALFTLLSTLDFHCADFWFCLGSCEQELEEFDSAISAYQVAVGLEPDRILFRLVLAECNLICGKKHDA